MSLSINAMFGRSGEFKVTQEDLIQQGGDNGFAPLYIGNYRIQIDEVNLEDKAHGSFISFKCTIIEGRNVNRKIWIDFMYRDRDGAQDSDAVSKSLARLKQFVAAAGMADVAGDNLYAMIDAQAVVRVVYTQRSAWALYLYTDRNGAFYNVDNEYVEPPAHVMADYNNRQNLKNAPEMSFSVASQAEQAAVSTTPQWATGV